MTKNVFVKTDKGWLVYDGETKKRIAGPYGSKPKTWDGQPVTEVQEGGGYGGRGSKEG